MLIKNKKSTPRNHFLDKVLGLDEPYSETP